MGKIELFNHLLRIITNGYLKSYSCVQLFVLPFKKKKTFQETTTTQKMLI